METQLETQAVHGTKGYIGKDRSWDRSLETHWEENVKGKCLRIHYTLPYRLLSTDEEEAYVSVELWI